MSPTCPAFLLSIGERRALDSREVTRPLSVPKRPKKKPAAPEKTNVVAQVRGAKPKPRGSFASWLWENIKSLAGAILIYLVIKTLFVEAFRIPSGSMIPTLMVGDWLFV